MLNSNENLKFETSTQIKVLGAVYLKKKFFRSDRKTYKEFERQLEKALRRLGLTVKSKICSINYQVSCFKQFF